jgi:hypothetical protein
LKFVSKNGIGAEGAAKLGEGLSKLQILTNLKLDIR